MSSQIRKELLLLANGFLDGIILALVYSVLKSMNLSIERRWKVSGVKNMFWGIGGMLFLFCSIYQKNDGVLRFYHILAAILGIAVWKMTLDKIVLKLLSVIFEIPVNWMQILKKKLLFMYERVRILFTKDNRDE